MAERQRRKPSNKIKPGTPHPTKANVVRGYDGRWVSKKHFETVTKARKGAERIKAEVQAKAKKGGALVKQAKSAVTKASKSDLLKIRKGDRGIVRAIKDTYKLGQDTRKSADAVYKAGKTTRKVHDQLVKGGKEFAKGTVEAGKATRRAYERLKPGGKIVKSKGSKLAKYRKAALKIVKSPGGKLYRPQGGKLAVRPKDKGGQIVKTPKVKTKAKVTPKVESARRQAARQKLDLAKKGVNKDTAFNRKYKVEGSSTNPRRVTRGGKVISEVNQGKGVKPKKLVKQAKTLGKKVVNQAQRLKNVKGYGKVVKGLKIGGKVGSQALKVLGAADITGSGIRQTGNLVRRIRKKPLKAGGAIGGVTTQFERDRIKAQNAYLKEHGSLKGFNKATSRWNKKKTDNNKLKVNKTNNKTTSTKSQLDKDIDNAKGWNKRQLQKKKDYQSNFGKLSNIPAKEGNATIKNRDGVGERINPDFGKKTDLTVKSKKKKSGSKYPATIGGKKTSAIQKKLLDAGWTKERLEEKMRKHKDWKAARGRR